MKNIRSKSIAALSIVLLLSSVNVRAMEIVEPRELAAEYENAVASVQTQVQPAKGMMKSVRDYVSTLEPKTWGKTVGNALYNAGSSTISAGQSVWAQRPTTLAEAKELVKQHPVIAGVAAVAATAATGYVVYKGVKYVKNRTIAKIEADIKADLKSAQTSLANMKQGKPVDTRILGENVPALQKQLGDKHALAAPLLTYGEKAFELFLALNNNSATLLTKQYPEFIAAVNELQNLGLNLKPKQVQAAPAKAEQKPTYMQRASAYIPTMETVKTQAAKLVPTTAGAMKAAKAAAPYVAAAGVAGLGYVAYNKGYLDGAFNLAQRGYNASPDLRVTSTLKKGGTFVVEHPVKAAAYTTAAGVVGAGARWGANKLRAKKDDQKSLKPAPELANAVNQAK